MTDPSKRYWITEQGTVCHRLKELRVKFHAEHFLDKAESEEFDELLAALIAAHSEAASPPAETRSDADYAIEHGEYLAKAAEFYLDTRNLADAAADDEEPFDPDRLYDANNALRLAIYEFRKRATRASAPPQGTPATELLGKSFHDSGTTFQPCETCFTQPCKCQSGHSTISPPAKRIKQE